MAPSLSELLARAQLAVPPGLPAAPVTGLAYDSRQVQPGSVFVAVPGFHVDGHDYAAAAVAAGAIAVIAERTPEPALPASVPLLLVADTRIALARLAATLFDDPTRELLVAGITGTDGKTTTTTMLWAAWQAAGLTAASLTTVDFRIGDQIEDNTTRQTTLEAVELQQRLRTIADRGVAAVALETSSHALELHRVDGVNYRAAVFTRITSEHLDLHGSREAYRAAKARLVDLAAAHPSGVAILDADDDFGYPELLRHPIANRLSYTTVGAAADLRAHDIRVDGDGVHFTASTPWGAAELDLQLAGRFNVSNALAALAAACATGAALDRAALGISRLDRVGGRMERVVMGQPFSVVIDYAHTAESLRTVLSELRPATRGRLWVVFGSGGERDREKRPEMGRAAAELADIAVITDEDPREEDRLAILDQIVAGAVAAGGTRGSSIVVIPDREAAVAHALDSAAAGDTVLLAGKGHESCIITGVVNVPYSERACAEAALGRRFGPG